MEEGSDDLEHVSATPEKEDTCIAIWRECCGWEVLFDDVIELDSSKAFDPIRRVDLGPIVLGVESIGKQPVHHHREEGAHLRVGEAPRGGSALGLIPDDVLDVVDAGVQLLERRDDLWVT